MRSTAAKQNMTILVLAIDADDARTVIRTDVRDGAPEPWIYHLVTPNSSRRGLKELGDVLTADELIVTSKMRDSPELQSLVKAIAPCFATTGGVEAALERAEVHL